MMSMQQLYPLLLSPLRLLLVTQRQSLSLLVRSTFLLVVPPHCHQGTREHASFGSVSRFVKEGQLYHVVKNGIV